eukprot:gene1574-1740_t
MDGKRTNVPFSEVGSGRMRFAPVKGQCSKEKKKGSTATKRRPNNTSKAKKVGRKDEKGGLLRFRLGETSPQGAIQFCKELTNAGQDALWPEVCQVRRNESRIKPPITSSLGPQPPSATRCAAAGESTALPMALPMEQLPMAPCKAVLDRGGNDDSDEDDRNDSKIDADVDDGDDWFDVFAESPTQVAENNAKLYGIELQRLGALVPLNKEYTEFAIPEFNTDWKTVACMNTVGRHFSSISSVINF